MLCTFPHLPSPRGPPLGCLESWNIKRVASFAFEALSLVAILFTQCSLRFFLIQQVFDIAAIQSFPSRTVGLIWMWPDSISHLTKIWLLLPQSTSSSSSSWLSLVSIIFCIGVMTLPYTPPHRWLSPRFVGQSNHYAALLIALSQGRCWWWWRRWCWWRRGRLWLGEGGVGGGWG